MKDTEKQLADKLRDIETNSSFNQSSARTALEFIRSKKSEGVTAGRLRRIADVLYHLLSNFDADFSILTQKQLEEMAVWINGNKTWKSWTIYSYIAILKNFVSWLNDTYGLMLTTKRVKAPPVKNSVMPEYLLTTEELNRLLNATDDLQNRLLIGMLYESGARIGEILTLKLQNISFNTYGARISVKGKTGQRVIPIIWYANLLRQFIETHPLKDKPESNLWFIRKNGEMCPMAYDTVRKQVNRLCKKLGIKKRVNLHLFRHTRLTELASSDLGEQTLKSFAGWTGSSKMAQTYIHLSNKNVEDSLLAKVYGIKTNDGEDKDKLKACVKCGEPNPYFAKVCQRCKAPLDEKELRNAVMSEEKAKEVDNWSKMFLAFLKVVEKKHPDIWEDMKEVAGSNLQMPF